ncbi:TPA: hypothetical protein KKX05_002766 [Legionella pneumophila]|nr:hypothetical protein [Legionella pneumophila]HAT7956413.1 hypothetical protein [Legionella pneumophila]HAU1384790.1 hypothetical protein [Legionella pneumophila]HAU2065943.1 hypothetical protein [Legionella pneumophila]HBD7206079.1 hypothetical protein [Legionella pneumophila]
MKNNWNRMAANILRAELHLRGLTYQELHHRLADLGVKESTNGIKAKINRGSFQFSFFLKCASAIGIERLNLDSIYHTESN